jgi:hypothetical protein
MSGALKRLLAGPEWEIFWLDRGRSIDFVAQFSSLEKADQRKVWALLETTAKQGFIPNGQKFKKIEPGLWEFKSFQLRIPCTTHPARPRCLVLLHVFRKKQDDWKRSDLDRAKADRDLAWSADFED